MPDVLGVARSKIGAPYVWGAKGPDTFDCSGFVSWCEAQVGVSVPSFTDYIAAQVPQAIDGPYPGDILLYRYVDPGQPGVQYPHTEFALGDGNAIGARWPGGVAIRPILGEPYEVHRVAAATAPVAVAGGGDGGSSLTLPAWWEVAAGAFALLWSLDLLP